MCGLCAAGEWAVDSVVGAPARPRVAAGGIRRRGLPGGSQPLHERQRREGFAGTRGAVAEVDTFDHQRRFDVLWPMRTYEESCTRSGCLRTTGS